MTLGPRSALITRRRFPRQKKSSPQLRHGFKAYKHKRLDERLRAHGALNETPPISLVCAPRLIPTEFSETAWERI